MKKTVKALFLILGILILAGGVIYHFATGKTPKVEVNNINMKLSSSAFENQGKIPSKYTCDGVNVSPPLSISDIPEGTKSLVLIVDDPDAPLGDWVHWTLWNINPSTLEIKEAEVPSGSVQGLTSFGKNEYGGPCPPLGTHHYQFKLYALDETLNIDASSKKDALESQIKDHIVTKTLLVGLYSKK